jgi:hypothetical protein
MDERIAAVPPARANSTEALPVELARALLHRRQAVAAVDAGSSSSGATPFISSNTLMFMRMFFVQLRIAAKC